MTRKHKDQGGMRFFGEVRGLCIAHLVWIQKSGGRSIACLWECVCVISQVSITHTIYTATDILLWGC